MCEAGALRWQRQRSRYECEKRDESEEKFGETSDGNGMLAGKENSKNRKFLLF